MQSLRVHNTHVRTLVVDDKIMCCLKMKMLLQTINQDWQIDCVHIAEVAALTFLSYDAIVMDEQLQDSRMCGSEAISCIRQHEVALQRAKNVTIAFP